MELKSGKQLIPAFFLCISMNLMAGHLDRPDKIMEKESPELFIAGNSTARNSVDNGWGSHLQDYFDPVMLQVVNRARAGRSSRTFLTEGWWDSIALELQPGDYVLIEFGHNDAGPINDSLRARGSIPSTCNETQEIKNLKSSKAQLPV